MTHSERSTSLDNIRIEEIIANKTQRVKMLTSNLYYEDRDKLKAFLMQAEMYVRAYSKLATLKDKILFVASYLREDVFKWFKLIMKDFLKNKKEERKFATVKIFTNVINFERIIKRMYEDIDAERIVER